MPILTEIEQTMSEKELVYNWLCSGRINYEDITTAYVTKIEEDLRKSNYEAVSYTYPLSLMIDNAKLEKNVSWIKDKAIGMLYSFNNERNGINFKKAYERYVKENNLNTNIDEIQWKVYKDNKGE